MESVKGCTDVLERRRREIDDEAIAVSDRQLLGNSNRERIVSVV